VYSTTASTELTDNKTYGLPPTSRFRLILSLLGRTGLALKNPPKKTHPKKPKRNHLKNPLKMDFFGFFWFFFKIFNFL
jgi:hypothetical protein